MKNSALFLAGLGLLALMLTACSTEPPTEAGKQDLKTDSHSALTDFESVDPSLAGFINNAYGYAIFPSIGKGAAGIGGAYGRGDVYQQGNMIGYADMTQGTVGASLGGETYSELLVFETKDAMDSFTAGAFAPAADASGVAVKAGVGATAPYHNGVATFVKTQGGMMGDVSVGGQKFNYQPKQPQ
jgi:lipid-binding SYLF domain-containing protein